jgi:regulator of sigma E protease
MLTWLAPLLVFGLVVFVHELGHFLAAKFVGVYAPVFSIGWGSRLWGIKLGETEYRLSWFPIGGYVAMASREDEMMSSLEGGGNEAVAQEAPDATGPRAGLAPIPWDPHALAPFGPVRVPKERWIESKSTMQRLLVMSAGVMMNIVLAIVVASGVFALYGRPYLPAVVDQVLPDRPAARAGLLAGDSIVAVSGTPVRTWTNLLDRVGASAGKELVLSVVRNGAPVEVKVTPEATAAQDPATGIATTLGKIGAAPRNTPLRERLGVGASLGAGTSATWMMAGSVVKVLKGLATGGVSVKQLGGPIAIARTSVQAAKSGVESLFALIAFLSINIAILNLLPIPLLDGGQIVMAIGEGIRGRPFSDKAREVFAKVGIAMVGLLFVVVMLNDVMALFRR